MEGKIFFVRHGDYRRNYLTEMGREQARLARERLVTEGIGKTALLLSSDVTRAVETAEILHEAIGEKIIISKTIAMIGFAGKTNNLEDYLAYAASGEEQSIEEFLSEPADNRRRSIENTNGLIVVTHAPLVAAVKGPDVSEDDIAFGEVVEYQPGSLTLSPPTSYDGLKISLDDILQHSPLSIPRFPQES